MAQNILKQRLHAGDVLFGTMIDSCCGDMVEVAGLAGFDYVILDAEHSPADPAAMVNLLRAAEVRAVPAIVRVPNALPSTILKYMDIGPGGVMVPLIHSPAAARAVVDAAKYGPRGSRGTAMMRSGDYGFIPLPEHLERCNDFTFVMVQMESRESFESLREIAETPGVDSVLIGPNDLAQSMGLAGKPTDPQVLEVIKKAGRIIRDAGKAPGLGGIVGLDNFRRFVDWGFQILQYSSDIGIFGTAAREAVLRFKGKG